MADPLEGVVGSSYCPVCGCLSSKGVIRCPECSTFHAGAHLEEREAPSRPLPAREVDPGHYSLSSETGLAGESFEESEDILKQSKQGGLDLRMHIDEFTDGGGGDLAAELAVTSADHSHYTEKKQKNITTKILMQ